MATVIIKRKVSKRWRLALIDYLRGAGYAASTAAVAVFAKCIEAYALPSPETLKYALKVALFTAAGYLIKKLPSGPKD
jgi:hypothetical protein